MPDKSEPKRENGIKVYGERPGDIFIRRKARRVLRLHKSLGVSGLYSTAYGNVGSSIYYALGVVAMSALGLTPAVLLISGILFLFTGLTYAEGAASLPDSGGSGAFARRAFNDSVSFFSSWVLMMDYLVTISISAFTAANYLGYFFPALKMWPANSIAGIAIVLLLAAINVLGIKESSRLNIGFVIIDIITQLAIATLGVLIIINIPTLIHNIHWGVAPTTSQLLFGISISMVAYTGIETVANLGSETRNPSRNIPRAILLVFVTVIILYLFLSSTALSAYPVHQDASGQWVTTLTQKYLQDPIMGLVAAMPANIQPILGFWVGILAVTILIVATNAGLIGASRLAYFMGKRGQLPAILSNISSKRHIPLNAILIFAVLACVLVAVGNVSVLADIYAFGAMLAYTSAHASIIALRIREPNLPRPFKIPLNIRICKREIPITAVVGGLGTGLTWVIVVYTHHLGRIVGLIWIAIGLLIYILYHRYLRKRSSGSDTAAGPENSGNSSSPR